MGHHFSVLCIIWQVNNGRSSGMRAVCYVQNSDKIEKFIVMTRNYSEIGRIKKMSNTPYLAFML